MIAAIFGLFPRQRSIFRGNQFTRLEVTFSLYVYVVYKGQSPGFSDGFSADSRLVCRIIWAFCGGQFPQSRFDEKHEITSRWIEHSG